jgi:secondary thiamine-phosphate synthase enzyme
MHSESGSPRKERATANLKLEVDPQSILTLSSSPPAPRENDEEAHYHILDGRETSRIVQDMKDAFERLVSKRASYAHNARWGDGNGFSHIRAALLGASLQIPSSDKKLLTGTWQQIVLVDFDNRPRRREVILQFMGET